MGEALGAIGGAVGGPAGAIAGNAFGSMAGGLFGGGGADTATAAGGISAEAARRAGQINEQYSRESLDFLKTQYNQSRTDIEKYFNQTREDEYYGLGNKQRGQVALSWSMGQNPYIGANDYFNASKEYYQSRPEEYAKLPPDQKAIVDSGKDLFAETGKQNFFRSPLASMLYGNQDPAALAQMTPEERLNATPGYNILQDQGRKAVERSASAKGYLQSPRVAEEIYKNSAGIAMQQQDRLSQVFNNYQDRLNQLAGTPTTTAAPTGQALAGMSQQYGTTGQGVIQSIGTNYANSALAAGNATAQSMMQAQGLQNQNAQNYAPAISKGVSGLMSSFGDSSGGSQLPFPSALEGYF